MGGQYSVLAIDIYKQVIGQQTFEMGAVVSVILLIPAFLAFVIDRQVQKRQVLLLSARVAPYRPKPRRGFDLLPGWCGLMPAFILLMIGTRCWRRW